MLKPYSKLSVSEMELIILNTDVRCIKVSITDGKMLILHYIGIFHFFMAAILDTIQNGRLAQDIAC